MRSRHIETGLRYVPAVARRLYQSRDLGEPFDFLTWFEYAPGDAADFAAGVNALVRDPARLQRCRTEAFRLARTRFNWETEQRRLVDVIERLQKMPSPQPASELVHAR